MDFKKSEALTFGLELEYQIVSNQTHKLFPGADRLHDLLSATKHHGSFALEATQSTIEINSAVHNDAGEMGEEVAQLVQQIRTHALSIGCDIRGGGTNMTQFWNERVMSSSDRARELSARFGFLPKRFSTYGMHVHVGMPSADEAIRVANALQGWVPLFISMSAASPFLQLSDTGFAASRPLEPLVYPTGGPLPFYANWSQFEAGVQELFDTGLAKSMKDIYWDVRPKPEFGTIEVRVFDTPLSVHKAVALAAFVRAVAALALHDVLKQDRSPQFDLQHKVSRFLACRDGMDAELFDPCTGRRVVARHWMVSLGEAIAQHRYASPDLPMIRSLVESLTSEEDHLVMREVWRKMSHAYVGEHAAEETLAGFSQAMRSRLLTP